MTPNAAAEIAVLTLNEYLKSISGLPEPKGKFGLTKQLALVAAYIQHTQGTTAEEGLKSAQVLARNSGSMTSSQEKRCTSEARAVLTREMVKYEDQLKAFRERGASNADVLAEIELILYQIHLPSVLKARALAMDGKRGGRPFANRMLTLAAVKSLITKANRGDLAAAAEITAISTAIRRAAALKKQA